MGSVQGKCEERTRDAAVVEMESADTDGIVSTLERERRGAM